ncbi:MAG: hypothetical protein ACOCV8_02710, partial [Spirochaetota bacterium]
MKVYSNNRYRYFINSKNIVKILMFVFVIIVPSFIGLLFSQQTNFYFNYSNGDKIVIYEDGQINWTRNYVQAKETTEISLIEQNDYSYFESVIKETGEDALEKLFGLLRHIKIDDYRTIGDIINRGNTAREQLSMVFKNSAKVLEPIFVTNTKFEVTARIPIYGPNS